METIENIARRWERSRWAAAGVAVAVLVILGLTIGWGALRLRQSIQARIVARDGEILSATARFGQIGASDPDALAGRLGSPEGQFEVALRLSELKEGVLAVRLYDPQGGMVVALPVSAREARLGAEPLARLSGTLQPLSRFDPAARLSDYFWLGTGTAGATAAMIPLQSVFIPLHSREEHRLLAVAELLMDGTSVAREFAALDRSLALQAGTAFLASGGMILFALAWAFLRLERVNRQMEAQASQLRRANQELTLAAKSSALGAVAAHFVHGLASPLSGLQSFVISHASEDEAGRDALRGTQRLQSLVGEMVRLLAEDPAGASYQLPVKELLEVLQARLGPLVRDSQVRLNCQCRSEGVLSARDANLILLILENLVENAIQASPRNGVVCLGVEPFDRGLRCEVTDEGPGLSEAALKHLFVAGRGSRPGGHGLGLAISHQLARHLGGEVRLGRTGPTGSAFVLELPEVVGRQEQSPVEPSSRAAVV